MNKQKLFPLLQDPLKTQLRDAGWLNDLAATYPYSPLVHALLAKAFQHTNEENAYKQTAALYMADRRVLKQLMEGSFRNPARLQQARPETISAEPAPLEEKVSPPIAQEPTSLPQPTAEEKQPAPEVTAANDSPDLHFTEEAPLQEEKGEEDVAAYRQSSVVSELEENLAKLRRQREQLKHFFEDDNPDEEPSIQESEEGDQQAPKAFSTEGLPDVVKELAHDLQPKELDDPNKKRQIDLIDSFLQRSANLQRKYRDAREEPESPQADLTRHYAFSADHTVTETMARLMEKQGRTEKAVEIYEKLSLKYPDKKAYFASCIEKLKHSN